MQLNSQKSHQRFNSNGGPVIPPGRESMEGAIQAAKCGSPGNIFFGSKTFSFSLKKHSKAAQKKANSQR